MAFDGLTLNVGTGGSSLATDSFTDTDAVVRVMPYGAVSFGPLNGPYVPVTATAGFPVHQQTGATWAVSLAASVAVTGTFWQATQPVSIASTVTVTGAAGTFPVTDSGGSLTVDAPVGTPVFVRLSDGSSAIATLPVSLASVPSHDVTNAGTFVVQAAQSGTWNIANVSGTVSLPTGAATAARQDTGNVSLASLDGKAPALGQALAAASVPVVLTAAQLTTLTPPAAIAGFATEATLSTLNGKVTACNTGAVTISAALPAGTSNIGDVDVLTVPADPFGADADAASATGSISAKLRFIASTGIPITGTVTVASHAVTNAGTFVVQVDGTALTRLTDIETNTDSGAVVGNGAAATAQRVTLASDSTGVVAATQSGTWTVQPGNTPNTTAWLVNDAPATSGGLSVSSFLSTAAVQSTAVKASAGMVYAIEFFNIGATPMYVRLYNQTGAPAGGDNANIVWRGVIPGSTAGAGFVKTWDKGLAFSTGIGLRCTGAIGDTDTTALAANTVVGNVAFK
jgi:hypothetical protein